MICLLNYSCDTLYNRKEQIGRIFLKKNVCLTFFFIQRNHLNQSKVPVKTIQLQDIKTKNYSGIQTGKN